MLVVALVLASVFAVLTGVAYQIFGTIGLSVMMILADGLMVYYNIRDEYYNMAVFWLFLIAIWSLNIVMAIRGK